MAKNKSGVDRRSFIAGIAGAGAGAAAAAATGAPAVAQAATTAPVAPEAILHGSMPVPNARLAAMESEDPNAAPLIDQWHVHNVGGDHMVDVLKHLGYKYITCMPGSSFRGIHESIINYGGNTMPEMLSVTHEEISAAMAHGYAKVSGKPMAIIVHNTVGLMHASMGIYNCYADRTPMMILVGDIADETSRRPGVEWYHTATDIAALARGFIKYDAKPISINGFADELVKAHSMMMTPPYEPVLVVVDGDLSELPVTDKINPMPPFTQVRPSTIDGGTAAEIAKLLVGAKNPVIVADRCVRNQADMDNVVALAETLQIPVVDMFQRMTIPTNHHLYAAFDKDALVRQADVILGLEMTDVFGVVGDVTDGTRRTTVMKMKPDCKVIAINSLYSLGAANYQDQQRFWEPYMSVAADSATSLPALIAAVNSAMTGDRKAQNDARKAHFTDAFESRRKINLAQAAIGWDLSPITVARMCAELWAQIKNDDFSLVTATGFQSRWPQRLWDLTKYHSYNGDAGAYGVGYNLPAAVGGALAARDEGRFGVNLQGDGDAMVAPGSLWTAAHHKIPLLTLMHNNRAWHQETMHIQRMGNRRERQPFHSKTGTIISDPNIDFAKMAESMGVHGEGPITNPNDLAPAIARALKVVKSGLPALVDVVTQPR